jgi:opacity protein-like surface antigen
LRGVPRQSARVQPGGSLRSTEASSPPACPSRCEAVHSPLKIKQTWWQREPHADRSPDRPISELIQNRAFACRVGGSATSTFKDVKAGWTAGGGIEGAFGGGWSAKLEYLHVDLGKTEFTIATPGLGTIASETRRTTDNIVRVGLNYKWGRRLLIEGVIERTG